MCSSYIETPQWMDSQLKVDWTKVVFKLINGKEKKSNKGGSVALSHTIMILNEPDLSVNSTNYNKSLKS